MLLTLFIIRHGKPAIHDGLKRYIGRTDLPLSAEGAAQAEALSRLFIGKDGFTLYTSPLARCKDFARIMGENLGMSRIMVMEDLAELNMGAWENRPMEEIKAQYPREYAERGRNLEHYRVAGGESFGQCQARSVRALRRVAAGGTDALVVSHAGVIRSLLCYAGQRGLRDVFSYKVPYGGVYTLTYEAGIFSLE
jgi:probable phosphoglycerate mutase